jgi:glycosyltransferase involved in cell wall biosynthesis
MTEEVELSVVLPCLNESETLATCIRKAQRSFSDIGVVGEVVVADNGSADGSPQIAQALGAQVVHVPTRGYGAALRAGIAAAHGCYVIMADADDSYALDDLEPYLTSLRGGADVVMGNRFSGGIEPGAMPALHRYLGNPVLSFLGRLFYRVPIGDFHCGMRGLRRDRVLALGLQTTGMEFASEMVIRASLRGLTITEVPTRLRPDGRSRPPHLQTWRDGWRHLRFLLAFCPRWLFLYPAGVLLLGGSAAMALLSFGPVSVGRVTFDVQTLLAAATAVIVGLQMAGLALVSRAYAARIGILPENRRLERLLDRFTLEWGLIVGTVMGVAGVACYVVATLRWRDEGFGTLAIETIRLPLGGSLLAVAGTQMVLISFMLSLTALGEGATDAARSPLSGRFVANGDDDVSRHVPDHGETGVELARPECDVAPAPLVTGVHQHEHVDRTER